MLSSFSLHNFKGFPKNIRRKLLRDIISLVLIISSVLLAITLYHASKIRHEASATIIADATTIVKKRFSRFVEPIETYLAMGAEWGKSGMLVEMNEQELTRMFIPMLAISPTISALMIADSTGEEFFLKRDEGQWFTRRSSGDKKTRQASWRSWHDGNHPLRAWSETIDYDPRLRPWFTEVQGRERGTLNWTEPYHFFTGGRTGVTASIAWQHPAQETFSVMALDLLEDDLLAFLNNLRIGDHGHITLIEEDGSIIAHNKSDRLKEQDVRAPVARAVEIWNSGNRQETSALEFRVNGRSWWAGFTPLNEEEDTAWIMVIIPESEMMGDVKKSWQRIAFIALAVLLLGFVLALRLVNKYSYQLRDLPQQNISSSQGQEELLALIEAGESATLEFKSTMRMNLKTGKKGKEIEIAWLKTVTAFMNSDGGILLVGVEDNGTIMGIERDGFENEDRCRLYFKSLINHHIGPEFSRFVTLKIFFLEEKMLLVIECERVRKPVFLTVGKNEDFFVRSGPSSMKLSMSQMMQYLEERP